MLMSKCNIKDLEEIEKVNRIFERRHKIIRHNNCCIIDTISFYENFLLNNIIKPYIFNDNYDTCDGVSDLISDRLSFMDRFKIVCKIAKEHNIKNFKSFDKLVEMRNSVAHNISSIGELDIKSKENAIFFGGKKMTWNAYLSELVKWSKLSKEMAQFILEVYSATNVSNNCFGFMYCKVMGDCVLVQNNLLYPEPKEEYTSFTFGGLDNELIQYINEEYNYVKN
jgi:hypothetical protein